MFFRQRCGEMRELLDLLGIQEVDSSGTLADAFCCLYLYIVRKPDIATKKLFLFGMLIADVKMLEGKLFYFK